MNDQQGSVSLAGKSGGIVGRRCWFTGFNISLRVLGCWIWAAEMDRMRAISVGVGIKLWASIERARFSQRGDVDIVHCRWFVPTFAPFPFRRCRSMASGLPLR